MGNRALLRSLLSIAAHAAKNSKVPFGQIFLAAPDVDADLFRRLAKSYADIGRRTTLYVSAKDQALKASGALSLYPRAGFVPPITVIKGIDTIEVSDVDLSMLGHGYFAEARDLLQDMYAQIWQNTPPPRFGLKPMKTEKGEEYWQIRK
jgi:esterase/lipase superfamily enzyme